MFLTIIWNCFPIQCCFIMENPQIIQPLVYPLRCY
jgi:hypothetical protein